MTSTTHVPLTRPAAARRLLPCLLLGAALAGSRNVSSSTSPARSICSGSRMSPRASRRGLTNSR